MEKKPLLSIGMIYKNEIRCLERCMKSLEPLRQAISCELVMADTGSTDGSREIAEKYADVLFDFPWIDDFSAARNAVLERCSGAWYLQIDADEWLDGDIRQLLSFLTAPQEWKERKMGAITIRNYTRMDLTGDYNDFLAVRMVLRSSGIHYEGAIHEHFSRKGGHLICNLALTLLHHDGYVGLGEEEGRAKRKRNMALLEHEPDSLRIRLQLFESSEPQERVAYIRRAVEGVEAKLKDWQDWGPIIYRYAVSTARELHLPELEAWAARAKELFPDSLFTKVDVAYCLFTHRMEMEDFAGAIPEGEGYLQAIEDFRERRGDIRQLAVGGLAMISPYREDLARTFLAEAYYRMGRYEDACALLSAMDGRRMDERCIRNYVDVLLHIQAQSDLDVGENMLKFWEQIIEPTPTPGMAEERVQAVAAAAKPVFEPNYRALEDMAGTRHAYTLFLPLAGVFSLGDTAVQLNEEDDPTKLEERLSAVEQWDPPAVRLWIRAMERRVPFPLPQMPPMNLEDSDLLAGRLAVERKKLLLEMSLEVDPAPEDLRGQSWARALLQAAVQACDWKSDLDEDLRMKLARKFVDMECAFLPLCYSSCVLTEEGICLLPPLHRFGWYCVRAFEALDSGDTVGYIRLLREGLSSSGCQGEMVEFLAKHTASVRNTLASPELLALAEQVQTLLAQFPPDSPAVKALKAGEAYQRVAWLIEE